MEDKASDYIQRLAEDVNRLVNDLGTFGCMDAKDLKKTPETRVREVYQWLASSKGCGEAAEYFKELLEIYLLGKMQAATGNRIGEHAM